MVWLKDVLIKKKEKKKKSQKGCIVKQHAVFSPTGQLNTFFLNCILSFRVHGIEVVVHSFSTASVLHLYGHASEASKWFG